MKNVVSRYVIVLFQIMTTPAFTCTYVSCVAKYGAAVWRVCSLTLSLIYLE